MEALKNQVETVARGQLVKSHSQKALMGYKKSFAQRGQIEKYFARMAGPSG
jgi:hypothetical protein